MEVELMIYKGLVLEELTDDEVLFFIRIRGKKSYFKNVYTSSLIKVFENIKLHRCISEYKKDADIYIDLKSVKRDYLFRDEYNDLISCCDLNEIRLRCRGLRSIALHESNKLIYRAYLFFTDFFSKNRSLKLIVIGTIDNFILDLMVRIGKKYGIQFLAITDSFMSPAYKLLTVRGEWNDVGTYKEEDGVVFKQKVLSSLHNAKSPKIINQIFRNFYHLCSYFYRYIIRYLFLYKICGRLEFEYRFAPYIHMFNSFDQIMALQYLHFRDAFSKSISKKAYIPLHYYPEATTDYWIMNLYDVDYLSSVLDTVQRLQKLGYTVYCKEHPSFFLARESSFYKALKSLNVIILAPFITAKKIFDSVDLVVVWNGSTGIESMIYGKDTIRITNSYYGDEIITTLDEFEKGFPIKNYVGQCIEKVYRTSFQIS